MIPSHWHAHVDVLVKTGNPVATDDVDPGVHGVAVAGMQGCGVSTPWAAAVADATCGLAKLLHRPKVATLAVGLKSMTVQAGVIVTTPVGVALTGQGVEPIEHCT